MSCLNFEFNHCTPSAMLEFKTSIWLMATLECTSAFFNSLWVNIESLLSPCWVPGESMLSPCWVKIQCIYTCMYWIDVSTIRKFVPPCLSHNAQCHMSKFTFCGIHITQELSSLGICSQYVHQKTNQVSQMRSIEWTCNPWFAPCAQIKSFQRVSSEKQNYYSNYLHVVYEVQLP